MPVQCNLNAGVGCRSDMTAPLCGRMLRCHAGIPRRGADFRGLVRLEGSTPASQKAPGDIRLRGGVLGDLGVDPLCEQVEEAKHGGGSFLSLRLFGEGTHEARFGAAEAPHPS